MNSRLNRYLQPGTRRRHWLIFAAFVTTILSCAQATAQSVSTPMSSNFSAVVETRAPYEGIPVCHSFDCRTREIISITPEEWQQVTGWFTPAPATAAEEREKVRHAIGWFEVVVSRYVPTETDVAGNLPPGWGQEGQLDCIDESHNTTTYLRLFEKASLLRYHRVVERAYRRAIFDQHWSGQIEQFDGGQRYVVDSWFQDNGFLPHVEPIEQWKDLSFFSSAYSSTYTAPE